MSASPKVLLIGLDAAEPSCVEKWAKAGRLPALARLMQEGRWSRLRSPAEEFPDEVWPSLYSSQNSAQFGKYFYIQPRPGSESLELLDDTHHGKQFWTVASEAGRRCAVVDAPKTAILGKVNGIQIANWGAHATRCEPSSVPIGLFAEMRRLYGDYPLHSCDNHGRSPGEYKKLRDLLIRGVKNRGQVLRDLVVREPWDLFFAGFSETHCSGHQFWHLQDPQHPAFDPEDRHRIAASMEDVYAAVDEEIGALLGLVDKSTNVIVFSGHGMAAQYHGRDLLPTLLHIWGLDGPRDNAPNPAAERRYEIHRGLVETLKEAVPIQFQYAVKSVIPKKIEDAIVCRVMGSKKLDPQARVNYVPNNDLNPAFRVNLVGRDPHGIVKPGEEYDKLLDFLSVRLRELVNPATGRPAIRKVTRLHDTYKGPLIDLLPDLTAFWSDEAFISEVHSPGYGTVAGEHHDLRTGGHAALGFLAMHGPGLDVDLASSEPNGKDIAPTVLELLGVTAPDSMEGRSLIAAKAAA
ncbi:MAG: alkaline phosphatase family protein [Bryobacterales bacterium]